MAETGPGAAIVTGGARRLGAALVRELASLGHDVAIHCHSSTDEAQALAVGIEAAGRRAVVLEADLADASAAAGLVERAGAALGPVTVLVNNAALFDYDRLASAGSEGFDAHMAVNLRAPVFLAQGFDAQLPADSQGSIVNLIDQRIWNPSPHYLSYSLSKSGLWMLTRMLAQELAPRIRVNAIGPGFVLPDPAMSQERFAAAARSTLLGNVTGLDEIAAALRYLLSAPSVTGQMIALDGGKHLGWLAPKER